MKYDNADHLMYYLSLPLSGNYPKSEENAVLKVEVKLAT